MKLRQDCEEIVRRAIAAVQPDAAVRRALEGKSFPAGRLVLVAAGKAAWSMARAAHDCVGERLDGGIVITKHGHAQGPIGSLLIREAGHPVPDHDTFSATEEALALTSGLTEADTVLFLLSGGGSALFEAPLVPPAELQDITRQLLSCGADIVEMNTIRKRLSAVKGGRFARHCAPAKVFSIVLSDIIGDPLDMIASGPAYPDSSTCDDARAIAAKYGLHLSPAAARCLEEETPKALDNVDTVITGSVRELCAAAAGACRELGYEPVVLTDSLDCEAREAGAFLAAIARSHQDTGRSLAFLAGGETVVHLTGTGLGGRNQELALSAAAGIAGLADTAVMVSLSTVFAYVLGLPLGVLLVAGDKDGVLPLPGWLMQAINFVINILRSIPFLILMICVFPLTRVIVGTTVGTKATIVPLVVAAFPFVARLVETSLRELDAGVIEAAQSMGATPFQIITKVMIPESLPSLISSMTTALTTILGYSAMSGVIGGGGLGKVALSYGYYRYQGDIMVVAVILLILLVQLFQTVGTYWTTHSDKRLRK